MRVAIVCAFLLGIAAGAGGAWLVFGRGEKSALPPGTVELNITDGAVYRVRKVVDGDTIVLENGIHVRYNGINAPEMGHFVRDVAPIAREATARNIALVEGKRVRLRLGRDPLDMHGRICARIFALPENGAGAEQDVCMMLVKEGLAKSMGLGVSNDDFRQFKEAENEARQAKAGIWGVERPGASDAAAKPYCAAEKSTIYHLQSCTVAKHIGAANLHQYATPADAEAAGLKPCGRCIRNTERRASNDERGLSNDERRTPNVERGL